MESHDYLDKLAGCHELQLDDKRWRDHPLTTDEAHLSLLFLIYLPQLLFNQLHRFVLFVCHYHCFVCRFVST